MQRDAIMFRVIFRVGSDNPAGFRIAVAYMLEQIRFPLCPLLWGVGRVRFEYPTLRKEREGWGTRRLVAG
jgi:hypothetical protein